MSSLSRSLLAVLAVSFLGASVARADTFNFSFGTTSDAFSGTAVLSGNYDATEGGYVITGITGTTDTGNGTNRKIAGVIAPGDFESNDNLVTITDGMASFDANGFSYILGNGAQINVYTDLFSGDAEILLRANGINEISQDVPYTLTANTPEPGSFLLLGTGLLGVAGMARRRFSL